MTRPPNLVTAHVGDMSTTRKPLFHQHFVIDHFR